MRKLSHSIAFLFAAVALGAGAGCLGSAPTDPPGQNPAPVADPSAPTNMGTGSLDPLGLAPGTASNDPNNTFNHESNQVDPFAVLARIQEQGPPEISSRLHSCQKLKYATLGNVLSNLGVNLGSTGATPPSGGELYSGGGQAMGTSNYAARVPETIEITAAGATKLFDIFTQSAQEIIAAMPMAKTCQVAGVATQMFDASGKCTLNGISCLTGAPASQAQVDLCNQALTEASTPQIGQTIAVAAILSAAHTCE